MSKHCKLCDRDLPLSAFGKRADSKDGLTYSCRECLNARTRVRRRTPEGVRRHRASCNKYEKTKKGFLMRAYHNMQSRVTGVQRAKFHLYAGCSILPREDFYEWALSSEEFHRLFAEWEARNYDRKLTPSVDRVDPFFGYELWNMRWLTHSENSRLGALNRYKI